MKYKLGEVAPKEWKQDPTIEVVAQKPGFPGDKKTDGKSYPRRNTPAGENGRNNMIEEKKSDEVKNEGNKRSPQTVTVSKQDLAEAIAEAAKALAPAPAPAPEVNLTPLLEEVRKQNDLLTSGRRRTEEVAEQNRIIAQVGLAAEAVATAAAAFGGYKAAERFGVEDVGTKLIVGLTTGVVGGHLAREGAEHVTAAVIRRRLG